MRIPPNESKPRQICPAGLQPARLIWAVDLGHQEYQGNWNRKLLLSFETSEATATFKDERGPEPFVLSITHAFFMTTSTGKPTKLRQFIEQWRGSPYKSDAEALAFDPEKALGQAALLVIGHKAKADGAEKAVINAITPLPKDKTTKPPVSKLLCYEIEQKTGGVFKEFPEWLQKQISESREFKQPEPVSPAVAPSAEPPPATESDDVPF